MRFGLLCMDWCYESICFWFVCLNCGWVEVLVLCTLIVKINGWLGLEKEISLC